MEEIKKYTLEELQKKLTEKERIFCHEYIIDWNGSRSARVAGYSEKTCAVISCENLIKPYIQQYIDFIKNDIEKEAGISKLRQLKKLEEILGSEETSNRDKLTALAEENKMLGYNAPIKQDIDLNTNELQEAARKHIESLK